MHREIGVVCSKKREIGVANQKTMITFDC